MVILLFYAVCFLLTGINTAPLSNPFFLFLFYFYTRVVVRFLPLKGVHVPIRVISFLKMAEAFFVWSYF